MSEKFHEEVLEFLKLHKTGYTEEDLRQTKNRDLMLELLPERKNLIHWIPFEGKRILEIGAGVGSLTVELLEQGASVDVLEVQKDAAAVIFERVAEDAPLRIFTDVLDFIKSEEKAYDWILLENGMKSASARTLTSGRDLADFLSELSGYLVEEGRILLVSDNRMGMKYFSSTGQEEMPFGEFCGHFGKDGQTRYTYGELQQAFSRANLHASFYYPVPDAYFPEHIFSEERLPDGEDFFHDAIAGKGGSRLFHEDGAFMTVLKEGYFRQFANTYLCILKREDAECRDLATYVKYSTRRKREFAISTELYAPKDGPKFVQKRAFFPEGCDHIQNILSLQRDLFGALANTKFHPCMSHGSEDVGRVVFDYAPGESLEHRLDGYLFSGEIEKVYALMQNFFDELSRAATKAFYRTPEFDEIFLRELQWMENADVTLSVTDVDLIFANVICDHDKWWVIDYEWSFRFPIPFRFLMFRCLFYYLKSKPQRHELLGDGLYEHFGLSVEELELYHRMEENFQDYIYGGHKPLYALDGCAYDITSYGKESPYTVNVFADYGDGGLSEERIEVSSYATKEGTTLTIPVAKGIHFLSIQPAGCHGILSQITAYDEAGRALLVSVDSDRRIDATTHVFLEHLPAFTVGVYPDTKMVTITYQFDGLVSIDPSCGIVRPSNEKRTSHTKQLRAAFGMKKQKPLPLLDLNSGVLDAGVDGYRIQEAKDILMGYAISADTVAINITDADGHAVLAGIHRVSREDINGKYKNVPADYKSGFIASFESSKDLRYPLRVQFISSTLSKEIKVTKQQALRGMQPGRFARISLRLHKGMQLWKEQGLLALLARIRDKRAKRTWEKEHFTRQH